MILDIMQLERIQFWIIVIWYTNDDKDSTSTSSASMMICFRAWYFHRFFIFMFYSHVTFLSSCCISTWPYYKYLQFHHISLGDMMCILIISNIVFYRREFSYIYDKYTKHVLSSFVYRSADRICIWDSIKVLV